MSTFTLTYAQFVSQEASPSWTGADTVIVQDTAAVLEGLDATQIADLAAHNVDTINSTDDYLNFNADQLAALAATPITLDPSDFVQMIDTGANIGALSASDIAAIAAKGVATINPSDHVLTFDISQFQALGAMGVDAGATFTIADSEANIEGLSVGQIGALSLQGVDVIDSTDDTLSLTVAQYQALSSVQLTGSDTVTLADTGAHIAALSAAEFAALAANGIDVIDASDDTLALTVAQYQALGGVTLTAGDDVTLSDTGTNIAALSAAAIANLGGDGIDTLDASDDALALTVAQYDALGTVSLISGDAVTLADTGANLAALTATDFSNLVNIDVLNATNDALSLSVAQLTAILGNSIALTAGDTVTLSDTGANLAGLSSIAIGALAGENVDVIDASDDALTLSLAQFEALGTVALTQADTVTISNNNVAISGMSVSEIQTLAQKGIDALESTNGNFSFDVAQADAFVNQTGGGTVSLSAGDTFFINDTGANISTLSASDLTAFGALGAGSVDLIATGTMTFNLSQYNAAVNADVTIDAGNTAVLSDTGSALAALTTGQIGALGGNGIDRIDASDNTLSLTVGQYDQLGGVALTASDTVTLTDTGANLAALDATAIAALTNIDAYDATDNAISLDASQLDALATASIALAAGDTITLSDSEANIEGLTGTELAGYATQGADLIHANDSSTLNMTETQVAAVLGSTAAFAGGDAVTLYDTGAHVALLTASQIGQLAGKGVDSIDASDDTLSLTVAQYQALGAVTLQSGDAVTLNDTGASLAALSATAIGNLSNIDAFDATDNAISLTAAQLDALSGNGIVLSDTNDVVTLGDTQAHIEALSSSALSDYINTQGADVIHATDTSTINVGGGPVATVIASSAVFASGDTVTLVDLGNNISGFTSVQIGMFASHGIDKIDASNDVLALSVAQYSALGSVALTAGDAVTLSDTGANVAALTSTQFGQLAAKGVDVIDASDNTLSLTAAQFTALGTTALTGADTITLADAGANIAALSSTVFATLASKGIDKIDATNNILQLSVAQYQALGSTTLASGDTVTLADTGAHLSALTAVQIGALAGNNIDILDATDDVLSLTVAKFQALGTVSLRSTDTVTLSDTGANIAALSTAQFNAMAAKGIDVLDATDDVLTLSIAQVQGLGTLLLTTGDLVTVSDTQANIQALTGAQLAALANSNVDFVHASNTSTLNFSELQVQPFLATNGAFTAGDSVTLADSGANIALLTAMEFGKLAGHGIDKIDASDNLLALTKGQYLALGATTLTAADVVTLLDTGANIAALTSTQFGQLAANGIDHIDASNDALSLTVAQFNALGTVTLTAGDTVTLADTGANLAGLTFAALAGKNIDTFDATDNALSLTVSQYNTLVSDSIALTAGDTVTLADTGANLAALNAAGIGALVNIDKFDATDNALTLSQSQLDALATASIALTGGDAVTFTDTEGTIEGISAGSLTAYITQGVDTFHASNSTLNMTEAQVAAVIATSAVFAAGDTVTLSDIGSSIAALTSTQFGQLASHGVDKIDASDDTLTITAAQYAALGTVTLAGGDTVTLVDTGAHIGALTATQIGALGTTGVDILDASDDALSLNVAQYEALGGVSLTAGDTVTLKDTGAHISAHNFASLSGIDVLDATDNQLSLTVSQYNTLVTDSIALTSGDNITLADTGANLAALDATAIGNLVNIDAVDATDNAVSLNVSQLTAWTNASISLAAADTITLGDSEANLEALTGAQLAGYVAQGVDIVHAADTSTLNFTVSQVQSFLATNAVFKGSDTVTLTDTGSNVAGLNALAIGQLSTHNVDKIDASDDVLTLTVAQAGALGSVTVATGDTFTLSDTGANIAALTSTQIGNLATSHLDVIDATDDTLALSVAQYQALGSIALTAGDTVTLADTGAHISVLSAGAIGGLEAAGIDAIDASDNALSFGVAQYDALGAVTLTAGDTVTLADTGANLADLTPTDINNLINVDVFDASDNTLSMNIAQLEAVHSDGIALTAGDVVTLSDTEANIEGLAASDTLSDLSGLGIDFLHASDTGAVHASAALALQVEAMPLVFAAGDAVTLTDTGAVISGLTKADLSGLAAINIDHIDATDDVFTFSLAQYNALGAVSLSANDTVTVNGTAHANTIVGQVGTQILHGLGGNDALSGDKGADFLDGGAGQDSLTGGKGADVFVFDSTGDTTNRQYDTILDFNHAQHDLVDLSNIDAKTGGANNAFHIVSAFNHHAAQLIIVSHGTNEYLVKGDVNGDGRADFTIDIHSHTALVAGDFIL